jgi:hypothetical protein
MPLNEDKEKMAAILSQLFVSCFSFSANNYTRTIAHIKLFNSQILNHLLCFGVGMVFNTYKKLKLYKVQTNEYITPLNIQNVSHLSARSN